MAGIAQHVSAVSNRAWTVAAVGAERPVGESVAHTDREPAPRTKAECGRRLDRRQLRGCEEGGLAVGKTKRAKGTKIMAIAAGNSVPLRSKQEVIINAPLEAVWSFSMDLTKIPEFHPRVVKVDLLSGKSLREPGASYQCHLSGGKHTCIEKDIEIIPLQKIVTLLPEDTFGISKILSDYRVETTFQTLGHRSTKVEISHYYSTTTLKAKLLNLIAKGKIARETQATLNAAKATIEAACRAG
jgi:hypothetical protein